MSSEKKRKLAMRTTKLVLQACTIILLWVFSHNPGNFVRDPFNAPLHAHTCTPHAEYNTKKNHNLAKYTKTGIDRIEANTFFFFANRNECKRVMAETYASYVRVS